MSKGAKLASDIKFYTDYSKYREDLGKSETWEDSVDRVMNMHRDNPILEKAFKNERFLELFQYAEDAYKEKLFLGSQRALQFGGNPILKHHARIYNCTGSYADRPRFFQEALYLLLCGCGVGFSVQKHHVEKLPTISKRTKGTKTFVIPDSIEGWSDAVGVLMSSYFDGEVPFPEYQGYVIHFDYSLIRPRGAFISGGFKAPGPDGLRNSLTKCEEILNKALRENQSKLVPIQVYDIVMHMSDSVLSGGVRRSATICLFSLDDVQMMECKTGNWFAENPQRARSNNSVVLVRDEVSREDFHQIMDRTRQFGEPGFVFVDHRDVCFNPCLSGSTLVKTNKGQISIREICEMSLEKRNKLRVFSYNEDAQEYEWAKIINGIKTKSDVPLIKVYFDDSSYIECTPDHRIYTEQRGYVNASDLLESDIIVGFDEKLKIKNKPEKSKVDYIRATEWGNQIYDGTLPWRVDNLKCDFDPEIGGRLKNFIDSADRKNVGRKTFIKSFSETNKSDLEYLKEIYDSGYGLKVIAKEIGISYSSLRTIFRNFGFDIRKGMCVVTDKLKSFGSLRVQGDKTPWSYIDNTEHGSVAGFYFSAQQNKKFYLRSTLEYIFAKHLDENMEIWAAEPFVLSKSIDGITRTYRPDFVTYDEDGNIKNIYEIKGGYFNDNNSEIAESFGAIVIRDVLEYTKSELPYLKELENWKIISKIKNKKVVRISDSENQDVYDLSVENNHNFFANNTLVHNCVEIAFWCYDDDGNSGWQGCNLTEGNGYACTSEEIFYRICRASAILGTIQATYTQFPYLGKTAENIFRRESLLGCSFTGWMDNPEVMLKEETMRRGAQIVKEVNAEMVSILKDCGIEIEVAARVTCCKPSGNSGVILGTSKLDGAHSPRYFRHIQLNKENEIAQYFAENYPNMIEDSVYSNNQTDYSIAVPIEARPNAIFKNQLYGIKLLDIIKKIQECWVNEGTNLDRCVKPFLRHNVSNTVSVEAWGPIPDYLYDNRASFTAVSFLSASGDKDWNQAPYTSVLTRDEIIAKYGDAGLFASGLIIDGLHAFDNNLWQACNAVLMKNVKLEGTRIQVMIMKDWIRRAKQFAKRFFKGNQTEMTYCLKDVHLYHKWIKVTRDLKDEVDLSKINFIPDYIDADTLGAISCAGGVCEI